MNTVDCDIHNEVPAIETLFPYLPDQWVEQINHTVFNGPFDYDAAYPPKSDLAVAPESRIEGRHPDPATVREQALGPDVALGILLCTYGVDSLRNPDQALALARAVNDWQIAEWLDVDSRLRSSIVVPPQLPAQAAAEIDRVADHPGFVQVALPARSQHLYGNRLFHPLWEAVVRHDLVGGIYFGGAPGNPPTAVGWPSYFIEEYVGMSAVFAAQVTSLVSEGTFDQFPSLRVTLLESGTSWLPSHMWRFDKEWKNLRMQVPWVRRPPSEYIREHIRVTFEPWDVPQEERETRRIFEQLGSSDMLLFGSGYPHQRIGDPEQILGWLPDAAAGRIRSDNARDWYRI